MLRERGRVQCLRKRLLRPSEVGAGHYAESAQRQLLAHCPDRAALQTAAQPVFTLEGLPFKQEAAIAKLYATEASVTATREATQIFGGAGFMDEALVARHYRDAKMLEIGEGTSEIQRLVISRGLGLPVG